MKKQEIKKLTKDEIVKNISKINHATKYAIHKLKEKFCSCWISSDGMKLFCGFYNFSDSN